MTQGRWKRGYQAIAVSSTCNKITKQGYLLPLIVTGEVTYRLQSNNNICLMAKAVTLQPWLWINPPAIWITMIWFVWKATVAQNGWISACVCFSNPSRIPMYHSRAFACFLHARDECGGKKSKTKQKKTKQTQLWCPEVDWSTAPPRRLVSSETFVVQTDWIARALNHSEEASGFSCQPRSGEPVPPTVPSRPPPPPPRDRPREAECSFHTPSAGLGLGLWGAQMCFCTPGILLWIHKSVNVTETGVILKISPLT